MRGLCNELEGLVTALEGELSRRAGAELESRLGRICDGSPAGLLQTTGWIIAKEELPEFRRPLERLLEKPELPSWEVGVFGRVSSGKSSLLNHLLGGSVPPVGVTPVTAVPVRIPYGEQPALTVRFAGNRVERPGVDQIALYASEEHTRTIAAKCSSCWWSCPARFSSRALSLWTRLGSARWRRPVRRRRYPVCRTAISACCW